MASQPSPRKKPRKQTLTSSSVRPSADQQWEDDDTEDVKRKIAKPFNPQAHDINAPKLPVSHYIKNQPHMSLLNRYLLYTIAHCTFKNLLLVRFYVKSILVNLIISIDDKKRS